MKKKVAIILNSSWNIINSRTGLLEALHDEGYELCALSPSDTHAAQLPGLHCKHIPIKMRANGVNPLSDLLLFSSITLKLLQERPNLILTYTIKPNIYGCIAARLLGIPVVANIAGLGTAFSKKGALQSAVTVLFRYALDHVRIVFFQNEEDRAFFIGHRIVRSKLTARLPGSGIDLARFAPTRIDKQKPDQNLTFILIARLLREKGIEDYADAARIVKSKFPGTRFHLVGFIDPINPGSIAEEQLRSWVDEGVVHYLGRSEDVRLQLAEADCMVLPSYYREGVPRVLLEAAAMALPIITCDTVGCRDAIDDGVTGWLCPPKSPQALAEKMMHLIELPAGERQVMGHRGREKMEREFRESLVIEKYIEAVRNNME